MEFNPHNMEERTQDIYEQLPHYPKPPMVPLPDWETMVSLQGLGVNAEHVLFGIVAVSNKAALKAGGATRNVG